MTDLDERLRTLLEERSRDYAADPTLPRAVTVRSRRRRAVAGAGGGVAAVAAIVLGVAALGAVAPPSDPAITPTPAPSPSPTAIAESWRGIWPQDTRTAAEEAQTAVDAGDADAVWQLDVGEVARRFARQELGFASVHFDESFDIAEEDSPGPFTIHVISCEPRDLVEWPPICATGDGAYSEITVERLLRADRTGIWLVTGSLGTLPTDGGTGATAAPVPGYPDTFVGLTSERDLLLASVADGSVIRTLLGGEGYELTLGPGALTPDGSSVYVTDWAGRDPRILRVPLDGGPVEEVARGSSPAIGPDGRLAYAGCGADGCGTELFVEVESGVIVRFDLSPFVEERVAALAWLPDGRVAVSVAYPGNSNPDVRVLDPSNPPRYVLDLEVLGRTRSGEGWLVLGYHAPSDGLAVQAYCCTTYAGDPIEAEPILSVDPDTGEHGPGIVEGATFDVALDRTGRYFLMAQISSADARGEELFLLEKDGELRPVGEGYVQAAW